MFCVFGKSYNHEYQRKNKTIFKAPEQYERHVESYFKSNANAYQISPSYSNQLRCQEFIELAKSSSDNIRCLYIARLENRTDKKGNIIMDKKTQQPKQNGFLLGV